jgi:hypothetical protein
VDAMNNFDTMRDALTVEEKLHAIRTSLLDFGLDEGEETVVTFTKLIKDVRAAQIKLRELFDDD